MLWVDKNAGISVWMNCHLHSVCSVNLNTRHREPMQAHHSSRPLRTTALFWAKGISSQNKRENDKLLETILFGNPCFDYLLIKCLYNTWTSLLQHWFHEVKIGICVVHNICKLKQYERRFSGKTCDKNVCKKRACTRPHSTCQPLILRGMREMNPTYFCITFRAYNTCLFLPSETSAIKGLSCNFENYANYVITQNTIKT